MGEDHGGGLPPFERLVRRHIKAVDEFVRQMYPAADADRVVYEVFKHARTTILPDDQQEVEFWLLSAARARARPGSDAAWLAHNADLVVKGLERQGELMTDWHAWSDLDRLIDCLQRLPVDQQEVLRLVTLYEQIGPAELSTILGTTPIIAANLRDAASSALRTAFEDDDPTAGVRGEEP